MPPLNHRTFVHVFIEFDEAVPIFRKGENPDIGAVIGFESVEINHRLQGYFREFLRVRQIYFRGGFVADVFKAEGSAGAILHPTQIAGVETDGIHIFLNANVVF